MIETVAYIIKSVDLDERLLLDQVVRDMVDIKTIDDIILLFNEDIEYYLNLFVNGDVEFPNYELDYICEEFENWCYEHVKIEDSKVVVE